MEVLTRPAGAPRGPPRVLSDASMTMSFALPASFLQARAARAAKTASIEADKNVKNDVKNAVEDSWEERDWEHEAPTSVENLTVQDKADEWEEDAAPELPDDFPRLIVNLTRVQRHHFPAESGDDDIDMMEVFHRVKATLHEHFSQLAEVLFEQSASCSIKRT
ncbi:unnamed protein product [Phytophthora fragariaefolia]|uniref:Unnamed protein product n=1 Tax=Phytophthora fragariaefolia TaxID=1490495 RepID=A0A9W6YFP6_9STRA|nr:unnamed protein product [Phytophthora fragariaefolia]